MTIAPSARKKASGKAERAELLPPRELRGIIETVLRLAKSTEAVETEVHVDEVLRLDEQRRKLLAEAESLKAVRNRASKEIGALMGQKKVQEADAKKKETKDLK